MAEPIPDPRSGAGRRRGVIASSSKSPLEEASAYLEGLVNLERRPSYAGARLDLTPIRRLLAALGHPERGLSVLHVAGSKGKGSTCLLAEGLLAAAGERVGTFTSPHLVRWSERFRIGGREVDGTALAAAVERLRPDVERLRRDEPEHAPSFFDATTAAAILLFADAGVDRAILEVGLGGRLDSTNAVSPTLTCITQIELEHTERLGDTLAAIAAEKAGILKPGVPCIVGALPGQAMAVVEARARALGAPLYRLGEEFWAEPRLGPEPRRIGEQHWHYCERDGLRVEVSLRSLADHQIDNACMALAAVRLLRPGDDAELAKVSRCGLEQVALPGRVELLGERPWLVVDGAHTPASARSLARAIQSIPATRTHLVLSISADKKVGELLEVLLPLADAVTVTRAEPIRSLDPELLGEAIRSLRPELPITFLDDPEAAVADAQRSLGEADLLLVAGSFYLAGRARSALLR